MFLQGLNGLDLLLLISVAATFYLIITKGDKWKKSKNKFPEKIDMSFLMEKPLMNMQSRELCEKKRGSVSIDFCRLIFLVTKTAN